VSRRAGSRLSSGSNVYSVRFPRLYRPTWAEIDLRALRRNLSVLKRIAGPGCALMFVVKADGYGHGAVRVAKAAVASSKAAWLGVSSVEEGVVLREAGLRVPILILGSLYPFESVVAAIRSGLTPIVASLDGARRIARAVAHMRLPPRRLPVECHLKLDTGMGRVGVRWPSGRKVVESLLGSTGVRLGGVFTHLARAEDDAVFSRAQLSAFLRAAGEVQALAGGGLLLHAANSAAALRFPESRFDLIRPGLAAYGLYGGLDPVLSLKSRIVFLKDLPKGAYVGYGRHYRTSRRSRIATLPVGYGDGLPRLASTRAGPSQHLEILVRGRRCRVVGALTMDMMMADVSRVPGAAVGDEVVLIGRSGGESVGAADWARAACTIPYEIVTSLSARVPRRYIR